MEQDEDVYLVIIGDEPEDEVQANNNEIKIKQETEIREENVPPIKEEFIDSAEKHGYHFVIEPIVENVDTLEDVHDFDQFFPTDIENTQKSVQPKKDYRKHKLTQQHSFVQDLRNKFTELESDKDLLIATLSEIMQDIKPPELPEGFCICVGSEFQCSLCGEKQETRPALERHYQERHGERYLVCFACSMDFKCTKTLYKHEKRCRAPDARIVLEARAKFLGPKGKSRPFLSKIPFMKRKRKICKKTKTRADDAPSVVRYGCMQCPAVYAAQQSLDAHMNSHRGEKPFQCQQCPCAYTSGAALSRHIKVHSDEVFICHHCGRQFKVQAALISHMNTHRPIPKHECALCGRRFAHRAPLRVHIDRDHRRLPPPLACHVCPKRYRRMYLLKEHMLKAHGMLIITRKALKETLPMLSDSETILAKTVLSSDKQVTNKAVLV